MTSSGRAPRFALAVCGALLFAASLAYFAWRYFGAFGRPAAPPFAWRALAIDVGLFSAFALHHSILARTGVKHRVAAFVGPDLERATFVWIASILFAAVCAYWQPVSGVLWRANGITSLALGAINLVGGWLTLRAAAILDVLDLAGVRPFFGPRRASSALTDRGPYGLVRHPIYFAWLLLVWPVATMTGTRLVFAAVSTLYLALAIPWEERSLRAEFGEAYSAYARKVRWRMLPWVY